MSTRWTLEVTVHPRAIYMPRPPARHGPAHAGSGVPCFIRLAVKHAVSCRGSQRPPRSGILGGMAVIRRLSLGLLVVSLCSCGDSEEQVAKKQVQNRQQAVEKALKNYPGAEELPGNFGLQLTIQIQDFFSANSGPFYVVDSSYVFYPFDVERSDDGVFVTYSGSFGALQSYRARLRCSSEQINDLLEGDVKEGRSVNDLLNDLLEGDRNAVQYIIVFTVDDVHRADHEEEPKLLIDGGLVALIPVNEEEPTP